MALDFVSEYQTKFKDLRKSIDDACTNLNSSLALRAVIWEPRFLMSEFQVIPASDIKEKIAKGNEIKTRIHQLVNFFNPLTARYNAFDMMKISKSISHRHIAYCFPKEKGEKSRFIKDVEAMDLFLRHCEHLDDTIDAIINFDLLHADSTSTKGMNDLVQAIPSDVRKELSKEVRSKMKEIEIAHKAKQDFNLLLNHFYSLKGGLGVPPRYRNLSHRQARNLLADFEEILKDAEAMDGINLRYIKEEKYTELIHDTNEYIRRLKRRIASSRFGAFAAGLFKTLLPVTLWLLFLAPIAFTIYTSIQTSIATFVPIPGDDIGMIVASIFMGLGNSIFRYLGLMCGLGYYWPSFYNDMFISPIYIQFIFTGVLILSIGLRVLFRFFHHFDTKINTIPLASINWMVISGLILMPFILSFAPVMVANYTSTGWTHFFIYVVRDGWQVFSNMVIIKGISMQDLGVPYITNPMLLNILFYIYLILWFLFNVFFRRFTKKHLVHVGYY